MLYYMRFHLSKPEYEKFPYLSKKWAAICRSDVAKNNGVYLFAGPGCDPERKQGPQSYGCKEIDSDKNLNESGSRFFLSLASRWECNLANFLIATLWDPEKNQLSQAMSGTLSHRNYDIINVNSFMLKIAMLISSSRCLKNFPKWIWKNYFINAYFNGII